MTGANSALRTVLAERYEYLLQVLGKRLRSTERAHDALHDAYVRLGQAKEVSAANPVAFVMRVALNTAYDRFRAESRRASDVEIESALDIADDAPDPLRMASARSEFLLLEKAIAELPARRRAIFSYSLKERVPPSELADRFGISRRRVDYELKLAREHCARVLLKYREDDDQKHGAESSSIQDTET